MIQPTMHSHTTASPQLHVLGGHFSVSGTTIPFFSSMMTLGQITQCIRTPNEQPGWTDKDVELEGLFQRQLDYKRVNDRILPYLLDTNTSRPRFFNSLTVSLVPVKGAQFISFDDPGLLPPPLEQDPPPHVTHTGPLTVGTYYPLSLEQTETMLPCVIRWNLDQVASIAIDGQHRLHALKSLHQKDPEVGRKTHVSVLFIVPSPHLGFVQNGSSADVSLLRVLRSVFIDLNKHTVPVKRSRLILLDDLDPQSVGVRRLIGERLHDVDPESPAEQDSRIPLGLVDWHTDDAKFDAGPYVTTVLMLDRGLQVLLGTSAVTDWSKISAIQKQFDAFRKLGYQPTPEIEQRLDFLLDEAEEMWQRSFSYPEEDLVRISDTVGSRLAPIVSRFLLTLRPYKDLIAIRSRHSMLTADFSSWYEAYLKRNDSPEFGRDFDTVKERIRRTQGTSILSQWPDALDNEINPFKQDNLFYKVVFQDALFRTLWELWRVDVPVFSDESRPTTGTDLHRRWWEKTLRGVLDHIWNRNPSLFQLRYKFLTPDDNYFSLWLGSVLNVDKDTVDFTASASQRITKLLQLMALIGAGVQEWRSAGLTIEADDLQGFLTALNDEDPDFQEKIERTMRTVSRGNTGNPGSMLRVVRALHEVTDDDEDQLAEEADARLEIVLDHLWESALMDYAGE